jgi:hypothetical protein
MSRRRVALSLLAVAAAAILLVVGIAIGEALHDNPTPHLTVTHTKTLIP